MKRLLALLLLLLPSFCQATTTTLTGTIRDAQGQGITGTLIMQLPLPAQDTTTNTVVVNTPVQYRLVNGVIQSGPPLFDVATLQPTNLYYIAKVYDSAGLYIMGGNFVVTGISFNLGAATPTTVTTSNISFLNPAGTNTANIWTQLQTFNAGIVVNVWTSSSANPAVAGVGRLSNSDCIDWRNFANSGDLPLCVNSSNQLTFASNIVPSISGTVTPGHLATYANTGQIQDGGTASTTLNIANEGVTGTGLNLLAKLTGAPSTAIKTATTDVNGAIGICNANCSTAGTASIQLSGSQSCIFDGATTAGDYVIISATVVGNCHDAGAAYPTTGGVQVIGRVLSTNAGVGTYTIDLYPAEIRPWVGIQASGTSTLGADNTLAANTLTTILTRVVTMPASGCPCRVIAMYQLHYNSSASLTPTADVTDGTNVFATSQYGFGSGDAGGFGAGVSPVTYANGAVVTFTLQVQVNGTTVTVKALAKNSNGQNSWFQTSVVPSL